MSREYSAAARAHARQMLGNSSHSRGADEVWDLVADAYDKALEDLAADEDPDYIEPDTCRPVQVEVDGKPVAIRVHGGQEMTAEAQEAFGHVVRAAIAKARADEGPLFNEDIDTNQENS
ncbi:MAG TPA: hypothetical protein VIK31_03165 [Propionibacteriaceae bacterium]